MSFDPDAFKAFEQAGWNRQASGYLAVSRDSTRLGLGPVLDAAGVGPGMATLDVATGPGYGAGLAADRGATACGVDFAEAMIGQARLEYPGVRFEVGDAEALPFKDDAFDAVTCSFGMLHFARPERAMAEALRVLKPGRRYAFSVWSTADRVPHFGMFRRALERHGNPDVPVPEGPPMFRFSDPEECRRTLAAVGFVGIRVDEIEIRRRISPEALVEGLGQATVRSRALLDGQAPEARAAIESGILAEARGMAVDGVVDMALPAVLASAAGPG